jgi:hypothetical protein
MVQDVIDTNKLVDQAQRDAKAQIVLKPLDFDTLVLLAVGDSSHMNAERLASQAGFLILARRGRARRRSRGRAMDV